MGGGTHSGGGGGSRVGSTLDQNEHMSPPYDGGQPRGRSYGSRLGTGHGSRDGTNKEGTTRSRLGQSVEPSDEFMASGLGAGEITQGQAVTVPISLNQSYPAVENVMGSRSRTHGRPKSNISLTQMPNRHMVAQHLLQGQSIRGSSAKKI